MEKFITWLEQRDRYNPKQALSVLGMDKYTSAQDVQNRYRDIAKKYHPDVNPDPKAHDFFRKASNANDYLKAANQNLGRMLSRRPEGAYTADDGYSRVEPNSPGLEEGDEVLLRTPGGQNAGREIGIGTVEAIEDHGHLDGIIYKVNVYRIFDKKDADFLGMHELNREWLHLIPKTFKPGDSVEILDYVKNSKNPYGAYELAPCERGTILKRMKSGTYRVQLTYSSKRELSGNPQWDITWVTEDRLRHSPKQLEGPK